MTLHQKVIQESQELKVKEFYEYLNIYFTLISQT